MTVTAGPQDSAACPIAHPLDQDADGVNRPGLYKNERYHEIRETGTGVTEVIRVGGTRAKLVTRYDDVMQVLRDQQSFSRERALDVDDVELEGTLLGLDLDDHAAVRKVVRDRFTRQAVEGIRGRVEARAAAQLAVMTGRGEPADLIEAFALPFALDVIGDILGLPPEDRAQFRRWGEAFLASSALSRQEAAASEQAMAGYLVGLIERRRREPTGDLLSQIAADGTHLPFDRLIKLPIALLVGGWETTESSIGTYVQVLLTHPYGGYATAYRYLTDHPEAIPGAVSELERIFSTAAADDMPRRVVQDVVLPSGAALVAGDVVIPSHDAANHDPRVFPDPHRIDFGRTPNRHLAFGYGAHHCIGRHLGHMEVVTAITLLTRELPELRLVVPVEEIPRRSGHAIRGPIELPVAWS
ncbi:cytochrome P450 [Streptosporangium becharense]|uniref:Cytochrome P450 n=1 Tax=Streptosporangium becharense TaxID=1816182 RepID=A0A7W9ICA3_9ACTN|nr:cytochrome P450 [Streptosporangium becharense]MBB2910813.1 cytochrome P450 [Streptosporangium becharense]MBB5817508.1 cytochrome P450 [Streptosporangium becharense]